MAMFVLLLPRGWSDNPRDGNLFGPDVVRNFLRVNNFEMCRGPREMAESSQNMPELLRAGWNIVFSIYG